MLSLLQGIYLFRGLSSESLGRIEALAESEYYANEDWIFRQGESADSFFIIQHGAVAITQDDEDDRNQHFPVATYGTGSHFGEMSLLDGEPRSANAVAAADCNIIRIRFNAITELLDSDPDLAIHVYRELAKFLCQRLRLTTLDLTYERSSNLGHL